MSHFLSNVLAPFTAWNHQLNWTGHQRVYVLVKKRFIVWTETTLLYCMWWPCLLSLQVAMFDEVSESERLWLSVAHTDSCRVCVCVLPQMTCWRGMPVSVWSVSRNCSKGTPSPDCRASASTTKGDTLLNPCPFYNFAVLLMKLLHSNERLSLNGQKSLPLI